MTRLRVTSLAFAALLSACSPTTNSAPAASAPRPLVVAVLSGDNQAAALGAPLPKPVIVRATDAAGLPAGGVELLVAFPFRGTGDRWVTADAAGYASIVIAPIARGPCEVSVEAWTGGVSNVATFTVTGL